MAGRHVRVVPVVPRIGHDEFVGELSSWLKHYADHPAAQKIHGLAQLRKPAGASAPAVPKPGRSIPAYQDIEAAQQTASVSNGDPMAGWKSGLAAWRAGNYPSALRNFAVTAESSRSSAWMSSAGAYWAARSALRARRPQEVSRWLAKAAQQPRTF